jgi:hypothetical protein
MRSRPKRRRRSAIGSIAVAAALVFAAYAFTASNTVPATKAGDGTQTISGYTITSVVYNLNASNPQNVDSLTFTMNPTTATTVKASVNGGTNWYACTNTAGSVSCTTTSPQATAAGATNLEIVATG